MAYQQEYKPEGFQIGPDTTHIAFALSRSGGVPGGTYRLEVRKGSSIKEFTATVDDGLVVFDIRGTTWERGVYAAFLKRDRCQLKSLCLYTAGPVQIDKVAALKGDCAGNPQWEEPECEESACSAGDTKQETKDTFMRKGYLVI